jgi:hypothetical protein
MKRLITSIMWKIAFVMLFQVYVHAKNPKIDPIKFTLTTSATSISLNEEFEIQITAKYQSIDPNLAYVFQGANSFKIKMVFPEGFRQTGGTYHDFIGADLTAAQPSVSFTVKGKFTGQTGDGSFLLLRGNKNAHSDGEFILVGQVSFSAFEPQISKTGKSEARIAAVSQSYIPYMTLAEFAAGMADTSKVIYINEGKKSGIFSLDAADGTTPGNGVLVLVYSGRRYKRKHDNVFYPEWWGAVGDGTTNDYTALQSAITAAAAAKAELKLNYRYLINTTLQVTCNVSGTGTLLTRAGAYFRVVASNLTIKDISVDGNVDGPSAGAGVYADGQSYLTFDNIRIENVVNQGFWLRTANYVKVISCSVKHTRGQNGDGIYVSNAQSPHVINNHISDFSRIGIVCEGNDTDANRIYTRDAIITGNTVRTSSENTDPIGYPNAGIWCENVAGILINGNDVLDIHARGIVVSPSLVDLDQRQFVISNNKVRHIVDSGNLVGTGIGFSYGENQVVSISGNVLTDCRRGMEVGYVEIANITANVFDSVDELPGWFNTHIYLIPSKYEWTSQFNISNCINNINSTTVAPISISDVFGQKANIRISDCTGNFGFINTIRTIGGSINVSNTLIDLRYVSSGSSVALANISGRVMYDNCDIFLPDNVLIGVVARQFVLNNCRVNSSLPNRFYFGAAGPKVTRVTGSNFKNVRFYDVRRDSTSIYLRNSSFEGDYHSVQGLFENTVTKVDTLEVFGNSFSKTTLSAPIQFAAGVNNFYEGHNIFYSGSLSSAALSSSRQSISMQRGATSQRPTITQVGYRYFDNDLNREIYWNGTEWIMIATPPSFVSNLSASAPSKSALNTLYGNLKAGSIATYQNVSGGYEYRKLTELNTSDWVQTQWSTGIKSLVP